MKSFLVIGLGRFGRHLTTKLIELGNEVMAVDRDEERVSRLASIATATYVGDCQDEHVLSALGVGNYDACFVCVKDDFQCSLEVTFTLKEMGAKCVVARADRERQIKFLKRIGADYVIHTEMDMVISAKGLLDTNPNPTREEAAFAIRNNICRCTGYVKIIDAILLAAEVFRAGKVPEAPKDWSLGARVPRVDVREKVTGVGRYPDDVYLDGMIYASAVRSEYPRARVLAIHAEEARALPGVVGVYTAADVPGKNKVGHLVKDWDTMTTQPRLQCSSASFKAITPQWR